MRPEAARRVTGSRASARPAPEGGSAAPVKPLTPRIVLEDDADRTGEGCREWPSIPSLEGAGHPRIGELMTTLAVANALAAVLVPLGFIGAALAAVCAVVVGIALARGSAELCAGGAALWIPSALLSGAALFAQEWLPLLASGAALAVMLLLGAAMRAIGNAARRTVSAPAVDRTVPAPTVRPAAASAATPAASTGSITRSRPAAAS